MTIEQKAKAYDEALKRAIKILDEILNNELIGFPDQIREIFPELRESEDERMMNQLHSWMKEFGGAEEYTEKVYQWLKGLLEKQKESLHISEKCKENADSFIDESEDERIRKALIDGVRQIRCKNGITQEQMLAYLEKQKEHKWSPSEGEMGVLYKLCYISNQITDEDDTELTRLYQDLKREYFNGHSFENMFPSEKQKEQKSIESIAAEVTKDKESAIKFLKSAGIMDDNGELAEMYRSEPKPAENNTRTKIISRATSEKQVVLLSESDGNAEIGWNTRSLEDTKKLLEYGLAFINKQLGTKSAEWSEEDEERIQSILFSIGYCKEEYLNKKDYSKDINWLKSLRPQPKKEWSKKDKKILQSLHHVMNCADAQNAVKRDGLSVEDVCNFLFSVEPNWKPSEEQMKHLERCFSHGHTSQLPNQHILESLYNELKKLM